jgi:hypothetical protein
MRAFSVQSQQVRDFESGRFPLYDFARQHFRLEDRSTSKNATGVKYDLQLRVKFSAEPIVESLTQLPKPQLLKEAIVVCCVCVYECVCVCVCVCVCMCV